MTRATLLLAAGLLGGAGLGVLTRPHQPPGSPRREPGPGSGVGLPWPEGIRLTGRRVWPLEVARTEDPDYATARTLARVEVPAGWCPDLVEGWPEDGFAVPPAWRPGPGQAWMLGVELAGGGVAAAARIAWSDGSEGTGAAPLEPGANGGAGSAALLRADPTAARFPRRVLPPAAGEPRGRLRAVWIAVASPGAPPGDDLDLLLDALEVEVAAVYRWPAGRPPGGPERRLRALVAELQRRFESRAAPQGGPDAVVRHFARAARLVELQRDLAAHLPPTVAAYPGPLRYRRVLGPYAGESANPGRYSGVPELIRVGDSESPAWQELQRASPGAEGLLWYLRRRLAFGSEAVVVVNREVAYSDPLRALVQNLAARSPGVFDSLRGVREQLRWPAMVLLHRHIDPWDGRLVDLLRERELVEKLLTAWAAEPDGEDREHQLARLGELAAAR